MQRVHSGAPAGVAVRVSARLHLGFLDLNGEFGRRYGSLGLSISEPRGRLTLHRASAARVDGVERERASRYLSKMQQHEGLVGAYHLTIDEAIPSHAGLGSGTQLALGVAAALRRLHGRALDMPGDARLLDRGARSGVGIGLFETGGLVVDGGRAPTSVAPPIVSRMRFPEAWRVILVLEPAREGLSGETERWAFGRLGPMGSGEAGEICRLALMGALPSIAEGDIAGFGAALTRIQRLLGDYFAPAQGGRRFASPDVAGVMDCLAEQGAHGVGQSSWGPTGFAFASDASSAERLADAARRCASARALDIRVVSALNRGAEIIDLDAPDA
jgi:beta-ribofuranosylaminobenzene 5'-phosphate synthase